MQRLQAVQNAAARLITSARRRDHVSPVLRQLHWLPVRQWVQFKMAVLKCSKRCTGQAPQCLTDDWQLVAAAGRRQLRSSDAVTFSATDPYVPQRWTCMCLSDRAFGVAGPCLWNALPISLHQPDLSLGQFRRALKTHLFDCVCRA